MQVIKENIPREYKGYHLLKQKSSRTYWQVIIIVDGKQWDTGVIGILKKEAMAKVDRMIELFPDFVELALIDPKKASKDAMLNKEFVEFMQENTFDRFFN